MSNQPGAAAPGFYPAENGRQRFWDGSQWTDRYADSEAPAGPQDPNLPSAKKKRSWFARHKVLTGLGVLLLLFIVIGLANGGKSSTPTASPGAAASPASSTTASSASSTAPSSASAPSTAQAAPTSTPASQPAAPAAPAETVSQQNAVKKAASYLQLTSFSQSGLVKQLQFDGFSAADATYGVDKSNTDWNEQAAKKAKDYLALTSFSRASLVKQLTFDGFTSQQAEYGVQKNGL